ncbi:MAG: RHS repeat-associated core domain-containing protein [Bacteroidales bacterium]|nr:RHS repeat-associated core domain-containing protein [Bacteroidales bacterium]
MEVHEFHNLVSTRYYQGAYEEEVFANGNIKKTHYISSPNGIVAMRKTVNGTSQMYYVLTDYLGSIDAVVPAVSGVLPVVEYYSYDAWGNRRDPGDWTLPETRTTYITDRGYTGHEMLDEFGLINANGRIYEPSTGRFLSPDNYVQSPDYSQSFNRYAYGFNNPMMFTDPDGELAWFVPVIIGAVAGFEIGGNWRHGWNFSDWHLNPLNKEDRWTTNDWARATIGAMVGAGVGLGFSSVFADACHITQLSPGIQFGFSETGAVSTGWTITYNAISTANINMASRIMQGGSPSQIAYSGIVGFGAGLIGGTFASLHKFNLGSDRYTMSIKGIRTQNYVTNILNGAGDRLVRSIDENLTGEQNLLNTFLGGVEGLISARFFSSDAFLNFGRGWNHYRYPITGRYLSSFLATNSTSNPGASFMLARIYGAIYPWWQFAPEAVIGFSPWTFFALSAIHNGFADSRYPYAYNFLSPDY